MDLLPFVTYLLAWGHGLLSWIAWLMLSLPTFSHKCFVSCTYGIRYVLSKTNAIFSPGMVFSHFILLWVQEMCCLFCSNNKQSEMGFTHIHCVHPLRLHNTRFCPCLMSSLLHSSYCIICSTSPISLIKEYSWISVLIASVWETCGLLTTQASIRQRNISCQVDQQGALRLSSVRILL